MRFLDLGVLQIAVDDQQVSPGGKRPAAVLSALLVHLNRRVSVDLLLEAVWGDDVTPGSSGTLETHIWRLRRVLEPGRRRGQPATVLINDSGGYRLLATAEQVDSARFEQLSLEVVDLLATGQPARALRAADEALAFWRGQPFSEVADRTWASGPIARLQELHALLQERRVDALLALGQSAQAVSDLEPLLAEFPFRERLWWQRMLALHRSGRTQEALQAYRQARQVLLDEIGMDPGPELVELHRRILQQDPTLDAPPPPTAAAPRHSPAREVDINLPRARKLFGREDEHAAVAAALTRTSAVTITGAAGSGKTRLAIEVARSLAERYADGVWFVDLSALDADSDVPGTVAAALGVTVPPTSSAVAALNAYSRDRQVLVVLDGCEQVLEPVGQLCDALLQPGRQFTVLATSREPIGHGDEELLGLDPLPVGDVSAGVDPGSEPAVALFLERARLPTDRLGPADAVLLHRICRAVDGIPLAIELAAALSSTYNLQEIADQVERDPGQLSAIGRGQARHHQTVAMAIDRSYQLLTATEQALHRRLSVVPGAFPRELAETVAVPELPGTSVPGLLARLVHRSLLTVSQSAGQGAQFTQLSTVRAHAAAALADSGQSEVAERRRDEWTQSLIRRRPRAGRLAEATWYATVNANLPTVRATLQRRVVAEPDRLGLQMVPDLCGYWYYFGLVDEGRRWAEAAVQRSIGEPSIDVPNRLALATLLVQQEFVDRARTELYGALDAFDDELRSRIDVAELTLAAATGFATPRDAEAMRRGLAAVEPVLHSTSDPDLAVLYEAVSCLSELMSAPLDVTLPRAHASFTQATAVGNLWAAWLSCSSINTVALARRDPEQGLMWSRRLIGLQTQLGARTVLQQLETFGDFLALSGQDAHAVRVFSATHHHARRSGTNWPFNGITKELLEAARRRLPTDHFDTSWAIGPTLSRTELTD
ncbi:MAG: BTAD domain-containing putative transcriptional regulator [Propionibacteriaceae bacterium]